jgi:Spy/CpxP family protein refolding chaperone
MLNIRSTLLLAAVLAVATLPQFLAAQADAPAKKDPAGEKADRASPLPDLWGRLAVDDSQRKELNAIRDDYGARIKELQKQIDALEAERDAKMEAKLTPGQKLRLQELREDAKKRADAEAAADKGNKVKPAN